MPEALALVKRELGPDALILGTRTLPAGGLAGLAGREQVEITAAVPQSGYPNPARRSGASAPATGVAGSASTSKPPENRGNDGRAASAPDVSPLFYPYYVQLVQNEVAADLARQLVEQAAARALTAGDARPALQHVIREFIASHTLPAPESALERQTPRRIAFVGPPGSGKTTTLVKLAAEYQLRCKKSVALLSLDVHGIGREFQLQHYADLLGLPLHMAQTIAEVKNGLSASENAEITLVDTPGIGFRDQGRFARTASLLRAVWPDETHLVLPASFAPEVQRRTHRAFAQLGLSSVILTRLDEVVGAGVILNVMKHLNILLSYVTTGQNVPLDLENACESRIAELVLGPSE